MATWRPATFDKPSANGCHAGPWRTAQSCYVRLQVFTALAGAQRELGFRHWDLRLANVMQHNVSADFKAPAPAKQESTGSTGASPAVHGTCFKVIDFGHGALHDRYLQAIAIDDGRWERSPCWISVTNVYAPLHAWQTATAADCA